MRVACPECTTPVDAGPGEEVICPACMARFHAPAPSHAQAARRFDVHLPDGTILSRQTVYALREHIYTGKVPITARMRPDVGGDELVPVYSHPPFAQIFALLNVEPSLTSGTRHIAGWAGKRTTPAKDSAPPPPVSRQENTRRFLQQASVPLLLALGVGAFFVLLLIVAMFVSW
ncbi:MAG: hypothetical protein FJ090_13440 [Deltaproteobacteria bacterium]|nr:hypothetical protein [Deltaproteobacteria bacterium]